MRQRARRCPASEAVTQVLARVDATSERRRYWSSVEAAAAQALPLEAWSGNVRDPVAKLIGQPCIRGRAGILELAPTVSQCAASRAQEGPSQSPLFEVGAEPCLPRASEGRRRVRASFSFDEGAPP